MSESAPVPGTHEPCHLIAHELQGVADDKQRRELLSLLAGPDFLPGLVEQAIAPHSWRTDVGPFGHAILAMKTFGCNACVLQEICPLYASLQKSERKSWGFQDAKHLYITLTGLPAFIASGLEHMTGVPSDVLEDFPTFNHFIFKTDGPDTVIIALGSVSVIDMLEPAADFTGSSVIPGTRRQYQVVELPELAAIRGFNDDHSFPGVSAVSPGGRTFTIVEASNGLKPTRSPYHTEHGRAAVYWLERLVDEGPQDILDMAKNVHVLEVDGKFHIYFTMHFEDDGSPRMVILGGRSDDEAQISIDFAELRQAFANLTVLPHSRQEYLKSQLPELEAVGVVPDTHPLVGVDVVNSHGHRFTIVDAVGLVEPSTQLPDVERTVLADKFLKRLVDIDLNGRPQIEDIDGTMQKLLYGTGAAKIYELRMGGKNRMYFTIHHNDGGSLRIVLLGGHGGDKATQDKFIADLQCQQ